MTSRCSRCWRRRASHRTSTRLRKSERRSKFLCPRRNAPRGRGVRAGPLVNRALIPSRRRITLLLSGGSMSLNSPFAYPLLPLGILAPVFPLIVAGEIIVQAKVSFSLPLSSTILPQLPPFMQKQPKLAVFCINNDYSWDSNGRIGGRLLCSPFLRNKY